MSNPCRKVLCQTLGETAGFSLIEMLVATAILSLTAVALLESQVSSMRLTQNLQQQGLAAIVAENRIAAVTGVLEEPTPGNKTGTETQLGFEFHWHEAIQLLPENQLYAVKVSVVGPDRSGVLSELTSFRRTK